MSILMWMFAGFHQACQFYPAIIWTTGQARAVEYDTIGLARVVELLKIVNASSIDME